MINTEPNISIGILSERNITFRLNGCFQLQENGYIYDCEQIAELKDGKILFNGDFYDEIDFWPIKSDKDANFTIGDVTIGIDFHWQRKEDQVFGGVLRIVADEDNLTAINIIPVEKYLTSVISSEMSATSSQELLKAHSVISRSWVLAQLEKKNKPAVCGEVTDHEIIKWYDRDDHSLFDVCADDHCQRYQGIARISSPVVDECISMTRGEILANGSDICDARFSKCCGGISESFENCWENQPHTYLRPVYDHPAATPDKGEQPLPVDLRIEQNAEAWIRNSSEAFCRTSDIKVLSQVLNNYDQETPDFYRWRVCYTQNEISSLLKKRTGIDFGEIIELRPLERGESGRIVRLKVVGSKCSRIIGKELEIRRSLSESHLYSSAFVVDSSLGNDNIPVSFTLHGAGWGHGVGLCQIGAAMMSEQGYKYGEILNHYFRGADIVKSYS